MRVDAKRNLKKVATELLKNPLQTQREIADNSEIGLGTTNRAITELEQNGTIAKNDSTIEIAENDLIIVRKGQKLTNRWVDNFGDDVPKREDVAVLTVSMRESQKRYSILMGANTDDKGADKKFEVVNYGDIKK